MYIKKEAQLLYEELKEDIGLYIKDFDEKLLDRAFHFAYNHHVDQKTLSGELYILHLIRSAINLAGLYADFPSIISGLLHDLIRDTDATVKDIEKKFGKEIANLVVGVTKISQIKYTEGMSTQDLDFLKKLFKIAGKDIRVFLIKICDRIDFIKNIDSLKKKSRRLKAKETLDIYVPLIKVFGIGKYIGNVEDLCYRYLEEGEFNRLNKIVGKQKIFLSEKIEHLREAIFQALGEKSIEAEIEGRIKTIYSISRKLKKKHIPLSGIYDLIALRIIVLSKKETYIALGILHSVFKCKVNRIKDYISAPKPNGYQSIHTTVSDSEGFFFEIQIQTKQMYRFNMFGLASHTSYKGLSGSHKSFPRWMKKLLSQQKDALFGDNFIESIKPSSLKDTIICMTPKGKEIELPKKSTVLDFAFKVHSGIGKRATAAWVNDEYIENLVYTLNDGDHVELELGNTDSDYPVRYLSFLQTSIAKKSLKNSFRNKSEPKRKLLGKHLLDERMELLGYKPFNHMPQVIKKKVKQSFEISETDSLYLEVGTGNIDVDKVVNFIYNLKHDNHKYKSTVSLKISFKKKDNKNIHLLVDLFHNLDVQIINIDYKGMSTYADIYVGDLETLHELLAEVSRLPNVGRVKRTFTYRVWIFLVILFFISLFIIFSPAILFFISKSYSISEHMFKLIFYISSGFFIFLLYFFKYIAKITLPGLIKQNAFWFGMFALNTFILATVIWEAISIFDSKNSVFFFSLTLLLYGLTVFEYLDWKTGEDEQ